MLLTVPFDAQKFLVLTKSGLPVVSSVARAAVSQVRSHCQVRAHEPAPLSASTSFIADGASFKNTGPKSHLGLSLPQTWPREAVSLSGCSVPGPSSRHVRESSLRHREWPVSAGSGIRTATGSLPRLE